MTDVILTHDASVEAFDSAGGVVSTDDDGVTFSWDEEHVVRVDAPADLEGAFDTERFYKIEDATVARPIKQPYMMGDELKWYKKPADELRKAAWSFDNSPFTISHPNTGMVKDVNDVHGFWRNVRYEEDSDRLRADLYVPTEDQSALDWIEENKDVSPGFYNRVQSDYDGDTGDLTDDEDLDGFQVDMFGNHIAGVERGRCSGEDGCGLDSQEHGIIVETDKSMEDVDTSDAEDCNCDDNSQNDSNMSETTDEDEFSIPDLSVDALAEKNESVEELREERDSLREDVDEMRTEIVDALDEAENFSVELDEDECPCEAVEDLVADLDAKAEQVEELDDELTEYRQDDIDEKLDELEELGADREDWSETADESDDPIAKLDEEIDRREEVLDAADVETSVKDVDASTDADPDTDPDENRNTMHGGRKFGRGHGA